MKISELVSQTVASGVPPLELTYRAVRDCHSSAPVAYRTEIAVNSVELGRLLQSEFSPVSDSHEVGIRVSEWGIKKALEHAQMFVEAERSPQWLSVPCPVAYAELDDFYPRVKALVKSAGDIGKIKLCLEFSEQLLLSKKDVKTAIMDLKVLGVRSLLVPSNQDTCPFFRLLDVPVDAVLLTPRMTQMVDDRNKPEVLSSLVQYLHSMHVGVVADGVQNSDQMRLLYRMECEGYLASNENAVSVEEAVLQKEAD